MVALKSLWSWGKDIPQYPHQRNAIIMKRSLIKVAAVAAIIALGGLGLTHDALAWGRFDGRHFGHGGRFTGKFHDHGRRVSPGRPPAAMKKFPPATSCRCTELSCCDGD